MQSTRACLADRRAQLAAECRLFGIRTVRPIAPILIVERDDPQDTRPNPNVPQDQPQRSRFDRYA